jgi:Lrp/AsnC family transcriptional regulator, regulator for asnA, asnC and gidA
MNSKVELDNTDRELLAVLREQPRISNRQIAERLHVTEGTIRNRIRRLQQHNVIAFTAIRRLDGKTPPSAAYIGIHVEGNRIAAVCDALAAIPQITFVATMLGRYDILACAVATDFAALTHLLHVLLPSIDGIKSTETSLSTAFVKHDHRWGVVLNSAINNG